MSPQELNALRKEVKKKLIDCDLDGRGVLKVIVPRLSERMGRPVHQNSVSMALTGFRDGRTSREILNALKDLLDIWPSIDFIEQSLGRVALPIPPARMSIKDVYRLSMQAIKEFGELMSCLDEAIADGRLTADEKAEICREGYEAVQAIMQLLLHIEGRKR